MNTDDFTENSSTSTKKSCDLVYNKSSSNKHDIRSCKINLGEFFSDAPCVPCCPDIKPSSDDCCSNAKKDICFPPCDIIKKECISVCPSCQGRLLILHVNLKNICPNKIIAVGVLIYKDKKLYAFKVKKIRTGCNCKCKDVDAGKFCFVFPDKHLCEKRKLKVKVISHYVRF